MRRLIGLLCLFLTFKNVSAAAIDIGPLGSGRPDLIIVTGELIPADGERFRTVAETTSNALVAFAGPGGSVAAGLAIGETIRLKNFGTVVLDGNACASACALAWLGGTRRFMGEGAKIGFHAAYDPESGNASGMANALVGAYLNKIGLPTSAVMYITIAKPDSILWLTQADAQQFGIAAEVLASKPAQDRPVQSSGERAQTSPMETDAIGFVETHVAGETAAISGEMLKDHYADTVFYYGKNLDRETVLKELDKFIKRWPERTYQLRKGSAQAQCFRSSGVCNVTAQIEWVAISKERGKRSDGSSTWNLGLVRKNGSSLSPQ